MSGIIGQRGIGQRSGVVGPAASAQPAFLVRGDDGTAYTYSSNWPLSGTNDLTVFGTPTFDQGNNVGGVATRHAVFTAPVAGKYLFTWKIRTYNVDSGDEFDILLETSNCDYWHKNYKWTASEYQMANFSIITDMDANDYAQLRAVNWGNSGVIQAGNETHFSGCLLA